MMRDEMGVRLLTKARAAFDLIRIDLVFGAGLFAVAGEFLALGAVPPLDTAVLGFLTMVFISGSANISNDYFDRDVDAVNRPERPLPSGRITALELWALVALFTVAGLAAAALLGPPVLALAAVAWAVALLYNMKFKEAGLFGNLLVAFCVGTTFIIGGLAVGVVNGIVLTFGALAFLFDLGEEIAADAMDVEGDELRSSRSLAKRMGTAHALTISGIIFGLFITLTFLPFLMGWFGYPYLLLVAIFDLCIAYFTISLVRSKTTEDGRVQVRRLYLTWGAFVLVFIVSTFF